KDPEQRWQNASDLASELGWIAEGEPASGVSAVPPATTLAGRGIIPWGIAALALVAAIAMGIAFFSFRESTSAIRLQVHPPDKTQFNFVGDLSGPPVISPDGTKIVFAAKASDGKSQLYLRSMNKLSLDPLPGTEDGQFPFWSPDGRSVGFFTLDKLK